MLLREKKFVGMRVSRFKSGKLMEIYLQEKIGNPDLFTGRKKELAFFLKWIEGIQKEISPSMAILSHRKTGKTALLQRLYNLMFHHHAGVIPFYFEVREGKRWAVEFCKDFYLTFIFQYIAFKTRKPEYIEPEKKEFANAIDVAGKEGFPDLVETLRSIELLARAESVDHLWLMVRDAPRLLAHRKKEWIVQMIDEFQYLNSENR